MAKTETNTNSSTATVVDGKLILSLPDAASPVIWQMDMEQAQSCALEIKEDKKNKQFILSIKDAEGKITEIAPYEEKQSAISALMAASHALQNAHGKIRSDRNSTTVIQTANDASSSPKNGKLGPILGLILILALLVLWTVSLSFKGKPADISSSETVSNGAPQSGVAMSADDFLNSR